MSRLRLRPSETARRPRPPPRVFRMQNFQGRDTLRLTFEPFLSRGHYFPCVDEIGTDQVLLFLAEDKTREASFQVALKLGTLDFVDLDVRIPLDPGSPVTLKGEKTRFWGPSETDFQRVEPEYIVVEERQVPRRHLVYAVRRALIGLTRLGEQLMRREGFQDRVHRYPGDKENVPRK